MGMRNAGGRAIPTLEKSCSRGGKAGKHDDDEEREERRGSRRARHRHATGRSVQSRLSTLCGLAAGVAVSS